MTVSVPWALIVTGPESDWRFVTFAAPDPFQVLMVVVTLAVDEIVSVVPSPSSYVTDWRLVLETSIGLGWPELVVPCNRPVIFVLDIETVTGLVVLSESSRPAQSYPSHW